MREPSRFERREQRLKEIKRAERPKQDVWLDALMAMTLWRGLEEIRREDGLEPRKDLQTMLIRAARAAIGSLSKSDATMALVRLNAHSEHLLKAAEPNSGREAVYGAAYACLQLVEDGKLTANSQASLQSMLVLEDAKTYPTEWGFNAARCADLGGKVTNAVRLLGYA